MGQVGPLSPFVKSKRLWLMNPPFYRLMGGHNNWMSLGLSYIAAQVRAAGHEVTVYNGDHVDNGHELTLDEIFDSFEKFKGYMDRPDDPIWMDIAKKAVEWNPDIVGITIVFSATVKAVENLARCVKILRPEMKVIVGGPHATLVPDTIKSPYFDMVCAGEGEPLMVELLNGVPLEKIAGLTYKDEQGNVRRNEGRGFMPDMDELQFPDVRLQYIPITEMDKNFGVIQTSRGCPFSCTFCATPTLWGKKVRQRSVENVIRELEFRHYEFGVKKIYFSDDTFNLKKNYVIELCKEIIRRGLKIEWICECAIPCIDREVSEWMKKAGCVRMKLGVESLSNDVLKQMVKSQTVEIIKKKIDILNDVGIDVTAYLLIGMPNETEEQVRETLETAKQLNVKYYSLSIATPQIGTRLYDQCKEMGIDFSENEYSIHQSRDVVMNKTLSKEIVREFLDLNRLRAGQGRQY